MLPAYCPSCHEQLHVKSLLCAKCHTEVIGIYPLPELMLLSPDEQLFILQFIKCSGSLKDIASLRKLSYPTVRNMLNDIIEKLNSYEK